MTEHDYLTGQSRFSALFQAAVEAIVIIQNDGLISDVNPAFETLFGYSGEEVIGQNVSCIMPEPDRSQHDQYLARYRAGNPGNVIGIGREVVAQHKTGRQFPIYLSVGEFKTETAQGYVGILRDLSRIKDTERRLQQTSDELEQILLYAPVAIFTLAPNGQIHKANRAAQAMLKMDNHPAANILELTAQADRVQQRRILETLANATDHGSIQQRLRYVTGEQQELMCQGHYALVTATNQASPFIILELADLTPLINAELEAAKQREALALAGRVGALGEMAASIAHELNQPLAAITLYAQTALRAQNNGADVSEFLQKIAEQSQRAGRVITQIRTLVSPQEQQQQRLDLRQLAAEALNLAEVDARALGSTLVSNLNGPALWVNGDPVQLQQVILNLLRNAFDAVSSAPLAKPLVKIEASADPKWAYITVCDNGPGVSEKLLPKLFQPFTSGKTNGMGIGLSLSQTIVHGHRGHIKYQKTKQGGACFTVQLPLTPTAP